MNPRAVSALVDLALWGLPLFLLCAAVVSRVSERRRRRAVAAARAVAPPVQQPVHVVVRPTDRLDETVSEDQWLRVLDSWTMPEQRRSA